MNRGFTLVEMLVVIAILAILAGMVAGGYSLIVGSTYAQNTDARLAGIGLKVREHLGLKENCPAKLTDLRLEQPAWMEGGVYVDAWGRPLGYQPSGKTFKLWSNGPDGVSGTADDRVYSN